MQITDFIIQAIPAIIGVMIGAVWARKKEVFSLFQEEPGGKISSGRVLCFAIIFKLLYSGNTMPEYLVMYLIGGAVLFYFATRVDKRLFQAVIMRFLGVKETPPSA